MLQFERYYKAVACILNKFTWATFHPFGERPDRPQHWVPGGYDWPAAAFMTALQCCWQLAAVQIFVIYFAHKNDMLL